MNDIKELSRNKDFKHKCEKCDTQISEPGFCRECEEKERNRKS